MAYFIVSEKKTNEWKILDIVKLDLRTDADRAKLRALQDANELVEEVPENKAHLRVYALVQGQVFWSYRLSTLKTATLKFAVEEKLAARRLKELLNPRPHGARKEFVEERTKQTV
ncbi:MAG: hypothetical protein ACYTFW_12545 [Planctomycetota bacterium]|jgi:hypothetical protein